jgi:NADPH:quinone reductase-like Zn-dependent oxidoreductase
MRQIVITRHGPPEVLEPRDVPSPDPGAGEIRIAVRAAGINFADVLARLGLYPDAPPIPCVVGYEVAGVVDAVGPGVSRHREGDRILALTRFGGYSESVIVPQTHAFPTPARLSDVEAAAIPVNYLTAYVALRVQAHIEKGETVLIHGAGGGVGIAAVQLAKRYGAVMIGTASAAKHDALRAAGVEHLIDYNREDVAAAVRRLTGGRGVDVVLDPLGGRSFRQSYRLLAPLGRLVAYGVSTAVVGERRSWWGALKMLAQTPWFGAIALMNENRGVFGLNLGHLWGEPARMISAMEAILREVDAGTLTPKVATTFPLERAAEAHRFLQSRANVGKVVLTCGAP